MNTPETINIEKYAEALNNLVGMDIGYLGESDENVNAIVEVIRAAKALENMVKELTEQSKKWQEAYDCADAARRELSSKCDELTEENERLRNVITKYEDIMDKVDTVQKMRDKLTAMSEFYLHADRDGGLLYVDFCDWIDQVAAEILGEE